MIRVQDLVKVYGTKEALRSVSFEIPPGQVCGYLGPNGAGKSTTVKILTGVLRPTSGRAVVAGFDVGEQPLEVKRRIGYVPETGAVYPMLSVNEYLALVGALHGLDPSEIGERSDRLLGLFKIRDAQDQRLDTLSKGMRQKVVISAAVLHDPDVLLFDEPLSGLDANAARTVKDLVRGIADRGKTVLYCSHLLDVVERLCDRVIILDQGQVVADGSPGALMASSNRDTLETVFRSLTGGDDTKELAEALLDAVQHDRGAAGRVPPTVPSPRHDLPTPSLRHGKGKRRRR
jgi:ABC-2 type transport system ATP-binding protein